MRTKYPLPAAVTSKPSERNLYELIMRFPKKGKGMKAYRKHWPENCYQEIWNIKPTSDKTARMYGVHYWQGELQSHHIGKINGAMKRGIWKFDLASIKDEEIQKYVADVEAGLIPEDELAVEGTQAE